MERAGFRINRNLYFLYREWHRNAVVIVGIIVLNKSYTHVRIVSIGRAAERHAAGPSFSWRAERVPHAKGSVGLVPLMPAQRLDVMSRRPLQKMLPQNSHHCPNIRETGDV